MREEKLIKDCAVVDTNLIRRSIEKGININITSPISYNPYYFAIKNKDMNMLDYLVRNGDVNFRDSNGVTILMISCILKNEEAIKYLVERGADVNRKNLEGNTALILACYMNDIVMVEYLLYNKANACICNEEGLTPLMWACKHNNLNLVRILINAGAYTTINAISKNSSTALMIAGKYGSAELVKYLVENGADVNLIEEFELGIMKVLKGFYPGELVGHTVLRCMFERNDINMINYLLNKGARLDSRDSLGCTELMQACLKNDTVMANSLIDLNANVNAENIFGDTPLKYACDNNNMELVNYLVETGADINQKNLTEETVLMSVCEQGNSNLAKYLIEKGANINLKDIVGDTALIKSCKSKNTYLVKYLIMNGADTSITEGQRNVLLNAVSDDFELTNIINLFDNEKMPEEDKKIVNTIRLATIFNSEKPKLRPLNEITKEKCIFVPSDDLKEDNKLGKMAFDMTKKEINKKRGNLGGKEPKILKKRRSNKEMLL
ncbi:MAG: ankyrin repeat domain-containing protein [Clostridiales bacterium]|nr:ankyrin repeat domain-containing protein [Clostridiales bacterium]